jgi:hypothetical protein
VSIFRRKAVPDIYTFAGVSKDNETAVTRVSRFHGPGYDASKWTHPDGLEWAPPRIGQVRCLLEMAPSRGHSQLPSWSAPSSAGRVRCGEIMVLPAMVERMRVSFSC